VIADGVFLQDVPFRQAVEAEEHVVGPVFSKTSSATLAKASMNPASL
jgi:hypothetical protein